VLNKRDILLRELEILKVNVRIVHKYLLILLLPILSLRSRRKLDLRQKLNKSRNERNESSTSEETADLRSKLTAKPEGEKSTQSHDLQKK